MLQEDCEFQCTYSSACWEFWFFWAHIGGILSAGWFSAGYCFLGETFPLSSWLSFFLSSCLFPIFFISSCAFAFQLPFSVYFSYLWFPAFYYRFFAHSLTLLFHSLLFSLYFFILMVSLFHHFSFSLLPPYTRCHRTRNVPLGGNGSGSHTWNKTKLTFH